MAKPIKITPILKGKDAVTFLSKIESNRHQQFISSSRLFEIKKDATTLKSILK